MPGKGCEEKPTNSPKTCKKMETSRENLNNVEVHRKRENIYKEIRISLASSFSEI